jgi:hypothetical protein
MVIPSFLYVIDANGLYHIIIYLHILSPLDELLDRLCNESNKSRLPEPVESESRAVAPGLGADKTSACYLTTA